MIDSYPLVVVAPVIGLLANCSTQVVCARTCRSGGPYRSLVAGLFLGFAVSLFLTGAALWHGDRGLADCVAFQALNVLTYLALAFGYFNFVNLTIASLRIRLLTEILAAGGSLERARLLDTYNTARVIELRIDRLVRGGHLRENNGIHTIGKKRFLVVALIYNGLRWLVIGPWPRQAAEIQMGGDGPDMGNGTSSANT